MLFNSETILGSATMIYFSVLVHEYPSSFDDMVSALNHFCQDDFRIVVCLSHQLKQDLTKYPNVIINEEKFHTGYGDGSVFFSHISNLNLIYDRISSEDVIVLHGSNELYVKNFRKHDILQSEGEIFVEPLHENVHYLFVKDRKLFQNKFCQRPCEGILLNGMSLMVQEKYIRSLYSFYRYFYTTQCGLIVRKVLRKMKFLFYRVPKLVPLFLVPLITAYEELLFPTLFQCKRRTVSHCYLDFRNNLELNEDFCRTIIANPKYLSLKRVDRAPNALRDFLNAQREK